MAMAKFILTIFFSRFIQIISVEVFVPPAIYTLIWKKHGHLWQQLIFEEILGNIIG